MKKKWLATIAVLLLVMAGFAEEPPIKSGGWGWDTGKNLNGRWFYDVAESYREQDGWAVVLGRKLHYWLYDTYAYWNGNGGPLIKQCIPAWIERMGYVIDFDNIQKISPNNDLASSVKALMKQRGCDVSVTLCTKQNYGTNKDFVVINSYDKDKDNYFTIIYYLIK